jgi:hypothetical protein
MRSVAVLLPLALVLAVAGAAWGAAAPANPEARPDGQAAASGAAKSSAPLPRLILGGNQTKAPAPAPVKSAPAASASPARAPVGAKAAPGKAAKADEPPATIAGLEIARGPKGFLGLQVSGGVFQLAFYDTKKKPAKADLARAVLRWTPNYKPGTEIYVLEPSGDGQVLTSPRNVRPPYQFKLFMSLFAAGGEEPVESFVVDFRQ